MFNELNQNEPIEGFGDAACCLFLGDLSFWCKEDDLQLLFARYGPILNVLIRKGMNGESLLYGFIALSTPEAARWAVSEVDGMEFMGRSIRVQLSSDRGRPRAGSNDNTVQMHVSFITKEVSVLITEKVLRDIFAPFGTIADVTLKKHNFNHSQQKQSGYGFVYYHTADSAMKAMRALKHSTVQDITLDCSISHKSMRMIQGKDLPQADHSDRYMERVSPKVHAPIPIAPALRGRTEWHQRDQPSPSDWQRERLYERQERPLYSRSPSSERGFEYWPEERHMSYSSSPNSIRSHSPALSLSISPMTDHEYGYQRSSPLAEMIPGLLTKGSNSSKSLWPLEDCDTGSSSRSGIAFGDSSSVLGATWPAASNLHVRAAWQDNFQDAY